MKLTTKERREGLKRLEAEKAAKYLGYVQKAELRDSAWIKIFPQWIPIGDLTAWRKEGPSYVVRHYDLGWDRFHYHKFETREAMEITWLNGHHRYVTNRIFAHEARAWPNA